MITTETHSKLDVAIDRLRQAVDFFDRVKASTAAERTAVGRDHWDWLESAARDVVKASQEPI